MKFSDIYWLSSFKKGFQAAEEAQQEFQVLAYACGMAESMWEAALVLVS